MKRQAFFYVISVSVLCFFFLRLVTGFSLCYSSSRKVHQQKAGVPKDSGENHTFGVKVVGLSPIRRVSGDP